MGLNRAIRLFWEDHKHLFLFWAIFFGILISISQALNAIAKMAKQDNVNNQIIEQNLITITKEEKIENEDLIQKFIELCKKNQIEQAYDLLSEECKTQLYPSINIFKHNYYNKLFNKKSDIEVEIIDNETYKIIFYEDMLESGKIEGRENIVDYYKIVQAVGENKLYINSKNNIK